MAPEADILGFCREHLARFKVPKSILFGVILKTSTGKLQKFRLREQIKEQLAATEGQVSSMEEMPIRSSSTL